MAWVKGQTGNPGGNPKDKAFADALRTALFADDRRRLRRIAEKLVAQAEAGEAWAIAQVADRIDGKPAQEATITHHRAPVELSDAELIRLLADLTGAGHRDNAGVAETPGHPQVTH